MEKDIENLIEELTKVRPEMLNEEALKLFNTIMAVLDERDDLIKRNKELEEKQKSYNTAYKQGKAFENHKWISKIKEKIEENQKLFDKTKNNIYLYFNMSLQELMEDK